MTSQRITLTESISTDGQRAYITRLTTRPTNMGLSPAGSVSLHASRPIAAGKPVFLVTTNPGDRYEMVNAFRSAEHAVRWYRSIAHVYEPDLALAAISEFHARTMWAGDSTDIAAVVCNLIESHTLNDAQVDDLLAVANQHPAMTVSAPARTAPTDDRITDARIVEMLTATVEGTALLIASAAGQADDPQAETRRICALLMAGTAGTPDALKAVMCGMMAYALMGIPPTGPVPTDTDLVTYTDTFAGQTITVTAPRAEVEGDLADALRQADAYAATGNDLQARAHRAWARTVADQIAPPPADIDALMDEKVYIIADMATLDTLMDGTISLADLPVMAAPTQAQEEVQHANGPVWTAATCLSHDDPEIAAIAIEVRDRLARPGETSDEPVWTGHATHGLYDSMEVMLRRGNEVPSSLASEPVTLTHPPLEEGEHDGPTCDHCGGPASDDDTQSVTCRIPGTQEHETDTITTCQPCRDHLDDSIIPGCDCGCGGDTLYADDPEDEPAHLADDLDDPNHATHTDPFTFALMEGL